MRADVTCRRFVAAWLGGHKWDWKSYYVNNTHAANGAYITCLKCGALSPVYAETSFETLH